MPVISPVITVVSCIHFPTFWSQFINFVWFCLKCSFNFPKFLFFSSLIQWHLGEHVVFVCGVCSCVRACVCLRVHMCRSEVSGCPLILLQGHHLLETGPLTEPGPCWLPSPLMANKPIWSSCCPSLSMRLQDHSWPLLLFYICIGALKSGSHALEAFSPVFRKAVGVEGVSEEEARGLRAHSALAVEQVQFPALKWNLTTVWNFRSGDLTTSFVCHRHQSCTYIFAYT